MLTVLTWLWSQPGGRATYTAQHVNIWADMVRRHLRMPHRLACVTSLPAGIDASIDIIAPPGEFEDLELPTWAGEYPQCLRRISLFRPDAAEIFGPRFVSMDLDCVIAGALDPLFATDSDFKMYRGTTDKRPYNGSMLLMTAGARSHVYETFTPEGAIAAGERYVGSDQAWISYALGRGEATWGAEDGVAWYGSEAHVDEVRLMFFPGHPKPWRLAESGCHAWIGEHYRRSPRGRCLILGHAASVWQDLEASIDGRSFDAVIASPEAAAHWPGDLLHIAGDDDHAMRLARMHGFADVVFCGRSERLAA